MSRDDLTTGAVIRYPFLWAAEAARGEEEGRKPRPTVVGFRLDGSLLLLFPITTKQPETSRLFVEIPDMEKRRAGLDRDWRSWIILDEINADLLDRSAYIEPDAVLGRFSRAFMLTTVEKFLACRRNRAVEPTRRYD